jgi:hypothetical protein
VLPPDAAAKPVWTNAQIAANLTRSNTSWSATAGTGASVTFGFRTTAPTTGVEAAGFSAFTTVQQSAARIALQSWADAANIKFVEASAVTAQIVFANTTSGPGQAWAYYPGSGVGGDVWINPNQTSNFQLSPGGYGLLTLVHEIGHAVGLSHPGDYDASTGTPTYATNALYMQDSRQYTDMSYFSAANTGASHGSSYGSTPLLHDILAVQRLYGVNTTVRTGNTVYGFNSTAGVAALDFSVNNAPVVAIVDAGGTDTLDLSGYAMAERVDLGEGAFSDVGGLTLNVAIAFGAVIENAIGGSGADDITGNAAANRLDGGAGDDVLTGGLGDDTLIGGIGTDTAAYAGLASDYVVTLLSTGIYNVTGAEGTDRLEGVEMLRFGASAAVAIDSVATITPATLAIAAASAAKAEGNSGSTAFTFTVTRAGNTAIATSAGWAVTGSGASAAAAADFAGGVLPSGSVSFLAGEMAKTITVNIAGDTLVEVTEGFTVTLSAPAANTAITTAAASGQILNDDVASAGLSILGTGLSKSEGNSGSTAFTFTVTRDGITTTAVSVGWSLTGSGTSAATASDFQGNRLPAGTVKFAAGETTKTVSFLVVGDTVVEANETFIVTLAKPSTGAVISVATAAGTISNDDVVRAAATLLPSGQEVFAAADAAGRDQLWVGDVVSARQLTSGIGQGTQPRQFVQLDSAGKLLFTGIDSAGRSQLFATDGNAVTQLSQSTFAKGLQPADFTAAGPTSDIFTGLDALGRSQVWSADGTSIQQLTSIAGGLVAQGITPNGADTSWFIGNGNTGSAHLWVGDGTVKGTHVVM